MDNIGNNSAEPWKFYSDYQIGIEWVDLPFQNKSTIIWRDTELHIKIHSYKTTFGITSEFTFLHKNKRYHYLTAKWKWTGGSRGDYPREIKINNYILKIKVAGYSLVMKEIKTKNMKSEESLCVFKINKANNDINFESNNTN